MQCMVKKLIKVENFMKCVVKYEFEKNWILENGSQINMG